MRRICCLLSFSLIGLLSSGCWIERVTTSPGAAGVVLDARSQMPLRGACAVVCRWCGTNAPISEILTNARPPVAKTDKTGHFSISSKGEWELNIMGDTFYKASGTIVVQKDGYHPAAIPLPPGICLRQGEPFSGWHDCAEGARWQWLVSDSLEIRMEPIQQ